MHRYIHTRVYTHAFSWHHQSSLQMLPEPEVEVPPTEESQRHGARKHPTQPGSPGHLRQWYMTMGRIQLWLTDKLSTEKKTGTCSLCFCDPKNMDRKVCFFHKTKSGHNWSCSAALFGVARQIASSSPARAGILLETYWDPPCMGWTFIDLV